MLLAIKVALLVVFLLFLAGAIATFFIKRHVPTGETRTTRSYGETREVEITKAVAVVGRAGQAVLFLMALAMFVIWVFSLGLVEVPAGNVGVVTNFGKVQDATLDPGIHWVTPIVSTVTDMDTRVQPHQMNEIDAATKEYQAVRITGTLNYHIDPRFASQIYQEVGTDFAAKIIDPALNDFVKTVTPDYSASDSSPVAILNKRDEIRARAMAALGSNLSRYHIIIDDIYIANISFSTEYQNAIEAKQVAAQQVQTEQQVLQQKQIQAQQKVVDAQAQADANVKIAEGQAKANQLLSQSLDDKVLQYLLIQKLADKISVIFLPSGQQFILDPKSLVAPSAKP